MNEMNDYRQQLREKVLRLAMEEFGKRGMRDIKMDDIAHRLRVSKRTLYELYADKEQLLLEGLQRQRGKMEREMELYARQEGVNVVDIVVKFFELQMEVERNVNPQFYADIRKCPRIMAFLEENKRRHDLRAADFIARGISEGLFRPDVNYEMLAEMSHYVFDAVLTHKLYERYTMKELVGNFPLLLVRGICTPKGITLLDEAMSRPDGERQPDSPAGEPA